MEGKNPNLFKALDRVKVKGLEGDWVVSHTNFRGTADIERIDLPYPYSEKANVPIDILSHLKN